MVFDSLLIIIVTLLVIIVYLRIVKKYAEPQVIITMWAFILFCLLIFIGKYDHTDVYVENMEILNIFTRIGYTGKKIIFFSLKFDVFAFYALKYIVILIFYASYVLGMNIPVEALKEDFFTYYNLSVTSLIISSLSNNTFTFMLFIFLWKIFFIRAGQEIDLSKTWVTREDVSDFVNRFDLALLVYIISFMYYYAYKNGVLIWYDGQYLFSSYQFERYITHSYRVSDIFYIIIRRITKKKEDTINIDEIDIL